MNMNELPKETPYIKEDIRTLSLITLLLFIYYNINVEKASLVMLKY